MTKALEKLLRRERVIMAGALAGLIVLAWSYLIWRSWNMSSAMLPGMEMTQMFRPWTAAEFFTVFVMWSVMMVGMMTPSIAPAILTHVRLGGHPVARNQPLAPVGWFAGGYLLAWLGFAFIASVMQATFLEAGLITPTLRSSSNLFGGIVLIAAGGYQLTTLKDACLSYCRSPLDFIHFHGGFRSSSVASVKLGLKHGFYCVGCCWALMAVLFVVGVMELLWIVVISICILSEKILPAGRAMSWLSGLFLITVGIVLFARTVI